MREPRIFAPGVVSTELREYGITFTPDGREAYFTRRPRRGPAQILVTRFEEGAWRQPEPWQGAADHDEAPRISSDGSTMIFASRRPTPGLGDRSDNLWTSRRIDGTWREPVPVAGAVNRPRRDEDDRTGGVELGPAFLPDGSILYWSRADPDWGADIFRAAPGPNGDFGRPIPLRLNSPGDETNVAVSPDGDYLIFQAYRDASGLGGQDLYVARRNAFGWDAPVVLREPLNSPANDGYPSFSPDGRFLFFASDRGARSGYYDIWYVEVDAIDLGGKPGPT